ncbi:uncharacterized protein METZ01_LOCUS303073, partial [marine metagenome]
HHRWRAIQVPRSIRHHRGRRQDRPGRCLRPRLPTATGSALRRYSQVGGEDKGGRQRSGARAGADLL